MGRGKRYDNKLIPDGWISKPFTLKSNLFQYFIKIREKHVIKPFGSFRIYPNMLDSCNYKGYQGNQGKFEF